MRKWELLYADDLVLTAESKEEVTDIINRWKEGMEQRGLKINIKKTKSVVLHLEIGQERGFSQEDDLEEGWEQTLFFVLNVINGVTKKTFLSFLRNFLEVQNFVCQREGDGGDDYGEDEGPGGGW